MTASMSAVAGKDVAGEVAFLARELKAPVIAETFQVLGDQAHEHRRSVGLVGASRIGRRVISLLRPFDLEVLVSDPYLEPGEAAGLGAQLEVLVSDPYLEPGEAAGLGAQLVELVELDDLARRSDIVSLRAPEIASTYRMINARRLSRMRDGATLLNTARGALVDTGALVAELRTGRIQAILDVTDPEPLAPDSPLYTLPNVVLTPHLAGAAGNELYRLGSWAVEELARWAAGEPFLSPVRLSDLAAMA